MRPSVWSGKYFYVWGGDFIRNLQSGAGYCSCLEPTPASTNPSPQNNGYACVFNPVQLICTNNLSPLFDIFINGNKECSDVTSCYCSKSLHTGVYSWYVRAKNHWGYTDSNTWTLNVIDRPEVATNPSPSGSSPSCSSSPIIATWAPGQYNVIYDVYLNNLEVSSCQDIEDPTCNFGTLSSSNYTWYVKSRNNCGYEYSPTWSFSVDSNGPGTAQIQVLPMVLMSAQIPLLTGILLQIPEDMMFTSIL